MKWRESIKSSLPMELEKEMCVTCSCWGCSSFLHLLLYQDIIIWRFYIVLATTQFWRFYIVLATTQFLVR